MGVLKSTFSWVSRVVPTLLVFALLGGVGWWGHHNGWRAPKWKDLFAHADKTEKDDWCKAHNVPDSTCIACHPELAGENPADWCKEHGVPESACTICHPEILTSGKADDWCKEHGVPESACNVCHPEIAVKGTLPKDDDAPTLTPESSPAKDPRKCKTHLTKIQFASPEALRKLGVKLAAVEEREMSAVLSVNGEVHYIRSKTARCASRVPGTVFQVERRLGDTVKQGDVLALIDAAEVGRAKSEFLQALALVDSKANVATRLKASLSEGFRTQTEVMEAEASVKEARVRLFAAQQSLANLGLSVTTEDFAGLPTSEATERLRFQGLPADLVERFGKSATNGNLIAIVAPIGGIVTEANAVWGDVVDVLKPLFDIADTSRMWVSLALGLEEIHDVALGQRVVFVPDGTRDEAIEGTVAWISTAANETTRTVEVRAEVPNTTGQVRAGTFGKGRIILRDATKVPVLPDAAVNWEGCCYVAFVRLSGEIFQTRKVKLGIKQGGFQEVVAGVSPGEIVAAEGSNVLRSDLLRTNLGAG